MNNNLTSTSSSHTPQTDGESVVVLHSRDTPLHQHVQHAVEHYLHNLQGEDSSQMYELFLHQLERPLLEAVLRHTRGNQSRTALMLGLNRGTLRSKLKIHGLL